MQLKPKKKGRIGLAIAKASLTLVCATSAVHAQDSKEIPQAPKGFFAKRIEKVQNWAKWSGQIGFLGYKESGDRVQALEPAIQLSAEFDSGTIWTSKLVVDSLTGASPNGALTSDQPQTFTSPSGKDSYTIAAGEEPLYDQFKDTRVNISSSWTIPKSRTTTWNTGFNASNEYDYFSLGAHFTYTKDSEDKNKSWSYGAAYTLDTIEPVGGVPTARASMGSPGSAPRSGDSETKETYDLLIGHSKIMSRTWIMNYSLSLGYSSGYMNDPYKFVTLHDETAGATFGDPTGYIHENRPDSRFKQSIFIASKNHLKNSVLTSSYRFMTDDWGIQSHTLEEKYNTPFGKKWHIEPGLRIYIQSAADFYKLSVGDSSSIPTDISADHRIGDLTSIAPGIKFIRQLEDKSSIDVLIRYYQQLKESSPEGAVGSQNDSDIVPGVDAYIVQINYIF